MRTEKYNRCGLMFIGQCFGMLCLIGCRWVWVELCGWDRNRGGCGDLGECLAMDPEVSGLRCGLAVHGGETMYTTLRTYGMLNT